LRCPCISVKSDWRSCCSDSRFTGSAFRVQRFTIKKHCHHTLSLPLQSTSYSSSNPYQLLLYELLLFEDEDEGKVDDEVDFQKTEFLKTKPGTLNYPTLNL